MDEPSNELPGSSTPSPAELSSKQGLDRRLFRLALLSVSTTIGRLGGQPLTAHESAGLLEDESIPQDTVVGEWATFAGDQGGVSYNITLRRLNEAMGTNVHSHELALIDVNIAPGPDSNPDSQAEGDGRVAGLIFLHQDFTARADLDHGTHRSHNPRVQEVLDGFVRTLGLDPATVYEDPNVTYDNDALISFSDGIAQLGKQ